MALLGQNDAPTDALGRADLRRPPPVDERLRRVRATTVDGGHAKSEAKEWACKWT